MAHNPHSGIADQSLSQYVNSCVTAGTTSGFNYPNSSVCQYLKAALAANTAYVHGAPSREVFDLVLDALGQ